VGGSERGRGGGAAAGPRQWVVTSGAVTRQWWQRAWLEQRSVVGGIFFFIFLVGITAGSDPAVLTISITADLNPTGLKIGGDRALCSSV
jgi:hypothetical protein